MNTDERNVTNAATKVCHEWSKDRRFYMVGVLNPTDAEEGFLIPVFNEQDDFRSNRFFMQDINEERLEIISFVQVPWEDKVQFFKAAATPCFKPIEFTIEDEPFFAFKKKGPSKDLVLGNAEFVKKTLEDYETIDRDVALDLFKFRVFAGCEKF